MSDFLIVVSHYAVSYLHVLLAWRFYPMRKDSDFYYTFWVYVLIFAIMHALYGSELLWEAMGWLTPPYFVAVFVSYNLKPFFVALLIPLLIGELNITSENPGRVARGFNWLSTNVMSLFYGSLILCVSYTLWMVAHIQPLEKWQGMYGNVTALFGMVIVGTVSILMYMSGLRPSGEQWKGLGRSLWVIVIVWMLLYLHSYYFWETSDYWSLMPLTQTLALSFVFSWYRFRLQFMDMILNQSVRILVLIGAVTGAVQLLSLNIFEGPPTLQYLVLLVYALLMVGLYRQIGNLFNRLWVPAESVLSRVHDDLPVRLSSCKNQQLALSETESFISSIFHCNAAINRQAGFEVQNVIHLPGEPAVEMSLGYIRGWIPWLSEANSLARIAGMYLQSHLQIQQSHSHSIKAEEQMTLAARAKLDAMRAQIRPHFLFNTLNSIHSFVRDDPAKAEEVIEQLSTLMRNVLSAPDADTISLTQEMDTVHSYLAIESARYGERLIYQIRIPEPLQDCLVPTFSVQPLVENVIKHAVDSQFEAGQTYH